MELKVIKRDGREELFDARKVENAILKACCEVDGKMPEEESYEAFKARDIAYYISKIVADRDGKMTVEAIQDEVNVKLMNTKRKDVAMAYAKYRERHAVARDKYSELMKTVREKLMAENVQNQNANLDESSFSGRQSEMASAIEKELALNTMPKWMADNHRNNLIYIHDLDWFSRGGHNCLSIPIDDICKNGFWTRQMDLRPPRSIGSACQLYAVIMQIQSLQQFGGVAYTHLDWTSVPFIRLSFWKHYCKHAKRLQRDDDGNPQTNPIFEWSDDKIKDTSIESDEYQRGWVYDWAMEDTEKETYQAVEALYHNLNSLQSRGGGQIPFSSINFGTCTLAEGRMFIKTCLDVSMCGLGAMHRTPIFPCVIFKVKKGVNKDEGDPNYDLFRLALECSSKRIYPNYANCDWSVNAGADPNDPAQEVATMGKRKLSPFKIS